MGLRVGHRQHDGAHRLAVDHRTLGTGIDGGDGPAPYVEGSRQVLHQRAQPAGGTPPHGPGLRREGAVGDGVEGVRPRPREPCRAPPLDHLGEGGVVVGDGEVRRAQVDRPLRDAPGRHPPADAVAAVDEAHRHAGIGERAAAGDARDAGTDDEHGVHRATPSAARTDAAAR
ncbi:hypothetical protein GCM10027215_14770 [Nocardioides zeae]